LLPFFLLELGLNSKVQVSCTVPEHRAGIQEKKPEKTRGYDEQIVTMWHQIISWQLNHKSKYIPF